ncbi:kinase-like domain-containing protein [Triangularia verruculosa]|uniref:Kinase-like domain-containing protein n=1 Tax=Triangularia verruculosa TaxID=2587418 RepID=A0AAN7AXC3_9PEZI|nr:kinase-like domain-containing protein [Triangularia verruculosa]
MPPIPGIHVVYDERRVQRIEDRGNKAYRELREHGVERKRIEVRDNNTDIIQHIKKTLYTTAYWNKGFLGSLDRGMRFVTRAQFDKIMTPEAVLQVVTNLRCYQNATADEHMRIAQDIYYGAEDGNRSPCRRLLASLIGTSSDQDAVNSINTFMDEGLCDTCLPLIVMDEDTLACGQPGHHHPSLGNMDLESREHFTALGRCYSVPFIQWKDGGRHCHYILRGGGPLPMKGPLPMEKNDKMNEEGDFGEVFKVEIDPSDRHFDPEKNTNFFALKKLKKHGDSDGFSRANEFDLEIRSLIFAESRALKVPGPDDNGQTKRHLIQPLATFEVYGANGQDREPTFYFLFPLADGNLKQFWEKKRHNATKEKHCGWMVEQFCLLSKALQCVHNERTLIITSKRTDSNNSCRHGDIKPSNFLWFEDSQNGMGRLVLGDFGMGRIHSKGSRSTQPTAERMATISYQAPEFSKEDIVTLKTDIFSLGCVFLEYITWLLMGFDALDKFADARLETDPIYGFEADTFYNVSQTKDAVWLKEGVKRWIQGLKDHKDCVEVVYDLLTIIEKDMLEADYRKRISSEKLALKLEKVWTKWQRKDSLYGERHWTESEIGSKATKKQDSSARILAISQDLLWKQKTNGASRRIILHEASRGVKTARAFANNFPPSLTNQPSTDTNQPDNLEFTLIRGKAFNNMTMEAETYSEDDTGKDHERVCIPSNQGARAKRSGRESISEDERHLNKRRRAWLNRQSIARERGSTPQSN